MGMTMTTARPQISRRGFASVAASAAVLAVAIGFYGYAAATLDHDKGGNGYDLAATFLSSNGLHSGADVVLAGVPIGSVTAITLDNRSMTSRVDFHIGQDLKLPVDSKLSIGSSTLTSGNSLLVSAGKSSQMLAPGTVLTDTCEMVSLEQQVSQYIFGSGGAPSSCPG